jgi:hypothetical protein
MSFIHPIFLPSSLSISSRSFASSLSHYTAYAPHPGPSLFFFRPIPVLSLFVPTSERSLSPQVHRNILCHASLILPVVRGFSDYLPSLLLVGVFVPLVQLHTHPSSFRSHSFYFFAGIPVPPYSPRLFSFLYSTQTVSCTLPFRPFSPRTLRLSFPLSLSTCFSCTLPLTMYPGVSLSTPSTHQYFSYTLSTSSCSFHPQISAPYISTLSTMLSNIIILLPNSPPRFLSPIPQTHPTKIFAFLTTSLTCALSMALSLKV